MKPLTIITRRQELLADAADVTVCLCAPSNFGAISQFYTCFEQVDDAQVHRILERYANDEMCP